MLTYTSALLARDLTVIGPLSAVLHLKSDTEHFDVFVRLCDVTPNGRSTNVSGGFVRVRPQSSIQSVDGAFTVRVSMSPTANMFKAGHQLRIQVSASAHPRFARNLGTDEPLATATTLRASRHEILDDPDHASMLDLPVITTSRTSSSAGWLARSVFHRATEWPTFGTLVNPAVGSGTGDTGAGMSGVGEDTTSASSC